MAMLGPFEEGPTLAVAVSGGPDSMTLCLLADRWAKRRSGRILALVVDHRLRPESTDEALRVGGWLDDFGIEHALLTRHGPDISVAVQARARAARYGLMGDYCRDKGILHLLLAHHRDDQAETMLLRIAGASGLDGLAAMAAVVEGNGLRLLRPLLALPLARLRATLAAQDLPSIDDPSNRNLAFGRVRMRRLASTLAADGVSTQRLTSTAAALGRARAVMEGAVANFLAAAVTIHPAGFCRLDGEAYRAAPDEIAKRALARMLLCIGGADYGPRGERLQRLHGALADGALAVGRTLGGCRVLPSSRSILICREPRVVSGPVRLLACESLLWDGRFLLTAGTGETPIMVRRLDRESWSLIPKQDRKVLRNRLPGAVRPSLPALCDLDGIVAVPHLGYMRRGLEYGKDGACSAEFRPAQGLAPAVFAFVATTG